MRTMIAVTSLSIAAMLPIAAMAQKADRIPDNDGPKVVRTIPIIPSFDQRWAGSSPPGLWLGHKPPPSDRFTLQATQQPAEAQNRSTGLSEAVGVVPVPGNRLRHDPIRTQQEPVPKAKTLAQDTRPAQMICTRHNLRTVWNGNSWRCRK